MSPARPRTSSQRCPASRREIFNTTDSSGRQCLHSVPLVTTDASRPAISSLLEGRSVQQCWSGWPAAARPARSRVVPGDPDEQLPHSQARRRADIIGQRMPRTDRPVPHRRPDQHHPPLDRTGREATTRRPVVTDLVRRTLFALALTALTVPAAWAQTPAPEEEDPDLEVNVSQPDFNLAALPTNLRLPKGKFAFRVTHRFSRPLGEGRLQRPARRLLRLRLGRADRARAALRAVSGRAGGHQPHLRSDHPVLQPVRPREPAVVPGRDRDLGQHRRHQQLQRQLLAGARRGRVARARDATARSTRTRSG